MEQLYRVKLLICVSLAGLLICSAAAQDEKWTLPLDGRVIGTPALSKDGHIYTATTTGKVYSVTASGAKEWELTIGGAIENPLVVGKNGTVYCSVNQIGIFAISRTGKMEWKYPITTTVSALAAGQNDDFFFTYSGKLCSVDSNGKCIWVVDAPGCIKSAPVINANGDIYIVSGRFYESPVIVYKYSKSGTLLWRCSLGEGTSEGFPAIGNEEIIYTIVGGVLYALSSQGNIMWHIDVLSNVETNLAISKDGIIFVITKNDGLLAIGSDGHPVWRFNPKKPFLSSPAVDSLGNVYIGAVDGTFYALDSKGNVKWSIVTGVLLRSSPALNKTGVIYFGTAVQGTLRAISGGGQPSLLGWPMPRGQASNRANIELPEK